MEAARVQSGGAPRKQVVVAKVEKKSKDGEMFPGLDDELMNRADNIAQEMEKVDAPKKLALPAKKETQETSKDRAARFFATHGMMDMGKMLGDEMSSSAAEAAKQEAAAAHAKMNQMSSSGIHIPTIASA